MKKMEKNYVKSVIEGLKSSSSSRVHETLLKTKNKIIANDNGIRLFRECGGLEWLLPHLRKPNEKVLDLTLSVLGNCCLEEESSLQVGKSNIFSPLVTILKTVCRDSIVGRTCRLVGNLALKNSNAESLHNHGIVTALVTVIENRDKNTSYPTLTMAVRAIRQLWMISDKREEMLELNVVRCVAILLTTECESAGIIKTTTAQKEFDGLRKSQEELISGILKCLGYFTVHATTICAEQIQGDGRGYQCLVALTRHFETSALKCLMNLCYISQCRPLLGIAGFVECLVSILQKISEVQWWPEGASRTLAHLSGESVNRARLRRCGGLGLLLVAARVDQYAMRGLLQYIFDDSLFQILINEGLISLLTDELKEFVATMDYEHNNIEGSASSKNEIVQNDNLDKHEPKNVPHTTDESEKKNASQNNEQSLNTPQCSNVPQTNDATQSSKNTACDDESKNNLLLRRKGPLFLRSEDELKVVIERDNMIVGFMDAFESDATDDSPSDEETSSFRRKPLKRSCSETSKAVKKKSKIIKMANKDWSAGVYWEPKSPEYTSNSSHQSGSRNAMSPDRVDQGLLSPYSDGSQSGFSPDFRSTTSSKQAKWSWSPESNSSSGNSSSMSPYWTNYQWSPSSSGCPSSPFSIQEESSDSEVSGRYSPVCSETDGDMAEVATVTNADTDIDAAIVAHNLDELIMDEEECAEIDTPLEDPNNFEKNTKRSRLACTMVLLYRVSHGPCTSRYDFPEDPNPNPSLEMLTGPECLNGLLDYIEKSRKPLGRAAHIIARVSGNALCLMSILRNRLALRIYNMSISSKHPPAKCLQCKQVLKLSGKLLSQLTEQAESNYGMGEICYQLLKGNASMKDTLSITLPYVVRNEKFLKRYFIDCNALNLLFTIITESKEEVQNCINALAQLATNVQIKDPKTLENNFKDRAFEIYQPDLDKLSSDEIVTFVLDDDSTVMANKMFLCENSDFFSAMLTGAFRESVERTVKLKSVSRAALEYLLTLLDQGFHKPKCDVTIFPMSKSLDTNLEVLLLADRFLFERLKVVLASAILQFDMTPETAVKIYVWSLKEGMGFLCVESVAYLLTGKMNESQRIQSFTSILSLDYKEQWLDDIKSMIIRHLVK